MQQEIEQKNVHSNRLFPSVIRVKTAPILVPWSVCLALWCLCSSTAIAEPGWGWVGVQNTFVELLWIFSTFVKGKFTSQFVWSCADTDTDKDPQLCVPHYPS